MLPTADDALATSAIVLKDGKTHGDLMAAQFYDGHVIDASTQ